VNSGGLEVGRIPQILGRRSRTRGGFVHNIKKDWLSTRFFAAIFRVVAARIIVMCQLQFRVDTSIALPTLIEDHLTFRVWWKSVLSRSECSSSTRGCLVHII